MKTYLKIFKFLCKLFIPFIIFYLIDYSFNDFVLYYIILYEQNSKYEYIRFYKNIGIKI